MYFFHNMKQVVNLKEEFKKFVKENPILVKYVDSKEKTWQEFYEMYDLYGNDNNVWGKYLKDSNNHVITKNKVNSVNDFISLFKNIDLDSLQKSIESVQRVISVFQDITSSNKEEVKKEYVPRPLYRHFED